MTDTQSVKQWITIYLKNGSHFSFTAIDFTIIRDIFGKIDSIEWTKADVDDVNLVYIDISEIASITSSKTVPN